LFGGSAVTALGLAGAWETLRRFRTRRRRWLNLPEPAAAKSAATSADYDAYVKRSIDEIRALVTTGLRPSPPALGAVLERDGVTVMLDDPQPAPSPAGRQQRSAGIPVSVTVGAASRTQRV